MRGRQRAALLRRCWVRAMRVALTKTTFIRFDEKMRKWTETNMERREHGRRQRFGQARLLELSRPLARPPRSQKRWFTSERRTCDTVRAPQAREFHYSSSAGDHSIIDPYYGGLLSSDFAYSIAVVVTVLSLIFYHLVSIRPNLLLT